MAVIQQYYGIHGEPPRTSFLGAFAASYVGTKTQRMKDEYLRRWKSADPMEREKIMVQLQTNLANIQKGRAEMQQAIVNGNYDLLKKQIEAEISAGRDRAMENVAATNLSARTITSRYGLEQAREELGAISTEVEGQLRNRVSAATDEIRAKFKANPGMSEEARLDIIQDVMGREERFIQEILRTEVKNSAGRERAADILRNDIKTKLANTFASTGTTFTADGEVVETNDAAERMGNTFLGEYVGVPIVPVTQEEIERGLGASRGPAHPRTLSQMGITGVGDEMYTIPTGTTGYKVSTSGAAPAVKKTVTTGASGPTGGTETTTTTTEPAPTPATEGTTEPAPGQAPVIGSPTQPAAHGTPTPAQTEAFLNTLPPELRDRAAQYIASTMAETPAETSIKRQIERLEQAPESPFDATRPWDIYQRQLFGRQTPDRAARTQRIIDAYGANKADFESKMNALFAANPDLARKAARGIERGTERAWTGLEREYGAGGPPSFKEITGASYGPEQEGSLAEATEKIDADAKVYGWSPEKTQAVKDEAERLWNRHDFGGEQTTVQKEEERQALLDQGHEPREFQPKFRARMERVIASAQEVPRRNRNAWIQSALENMPASVRQTPEITRLRQSVDSSKKPYSIEDLGMFYEAMETPASESQSTQWLPAETTRRTESMVPASELNIVMPGYRAKERAELAKERIRIAPIVSTGEMEIRQDVPDEEHQKKSTIQRKPSKDAQQTVPNDIYANSPEDEILIQPAASMIVDSEDVLIQPAASKNTEEPAQPRIVEPMRPKKLKPPYGRVTYSVEPPEPPPGSGATFQEHQAYIDKEVAEALKPRQRTKPNQPEEIVIKTVPNDIYAISPEETSARVEASGIPAAQPKKPKKAKKPKTPEEPATADGTDEDEEDTGPTP